MRHADQCVSKAKHSGQSFFAPWQPFWDKDDSMATQRLALTACCLPRRGG